MMFGRSEPPIVLSPMQRTILANMREFAWESPLVMTIHGIPLEDTTAAMADLRVKGLLETDEKGEFSSSYDPGPKYRLTRKGRRAARS